jgi:hypothetical protein
MVGTNGVGFASNDVAISIAICSGHLGRLRSFFQSTLILKHTS